MENERGQPRDIIFSIGEGIITISGLFILMSGLVLLGRAIYWLRTGDWLDSTCDIILAGLREVGAPFCRGLTTEWIGLNELSRWLLWGPDASVLLLMLGILFMVIGILTMFVGA